MALTLGILGADVRADVLKLRDGTSVEGKLVKSTDGGIRFQVGNEVRFYQESEILSVTSASAEPTATEAPAPVPAINPAAASTAAPAAQGGTVPAGTVLMVRLEDDITSGHPVGYKFAGELETDLKAGDAIVAKAGTPVYGEVVESRQQGLVGRSSLAIQLTGIRVNGVIVPLTTEVLAGQGDRKVKSAARAAGAGALIGAAVDGEEGAGKGAGIGAAVSTLRRQTVGVPENTLLEFTLAQPLTIAQGEAGG